MSAKYPWPYNRNPACTLTARCGRCQKDVQSALARQKWATRTFQPATRWDAWSPDEIELVRLLAGSMHPLAILSELAQRYPVAKPRTWSALRTAASDHNISLARRDYSTPELAKAFGCSTYDHVAEWIEKGYLRARRWNRAADAKTVWVVSHEDAETFVREYPWIYDLGLMDQSHPLFGIARAAWRGEQWLSSGELGLKLGLSAGYVADLAHRGILQGERRGMAWMFRASQIREFRMVIDERHKHRLMMLRTYRLKRPERAA